MKNPKNFICGSCESYIPTNHTDVEKIVYYPNRFYIIDNDERNKISCTNCGSKQSLYLLNDNNFIPLRKDFDTIDLRGKIIKIEINGIIDNVDNLIEIINNESSYFKLNKNSASVIEFNFTENMKYIANGKMASYYSVKTFKCFGFHLLHNLKQNTTTLYCSDVMSIGV